MEATWPEMTLEPVGKVSSPIKTPVLKAQKDGLSSEISAKSMMHEHERIQNTLSEIRIFDAWTPLLQGLEAFSHILVLYWPHLIGPDKRKLQHVHPMGNKEIPKQGIFATCSPARPNPVLVSAIQLIEIKGNVLKVKGLEAVDGSPVIDIKPYSPHYLIAKDLHTPDWFPKD